MAGKYITIATAGKVKFRGYLATPAKGSGPGILLLQEIFGVNQHMRDVADLYAAEGYTVLCPDLFWRLQPGIELGQSDADRAKAFELYGKFDVAKCITDMRASVRALKKQPKCKGKVAAIGFCLGGKLAYLVAAWAFTRDVWGGAAVHYDSRRLFNMAKAGIPLTVSLTLLALSSVIDRFIIAHLIGPAAAGQYSAGVDLVRQSLIIPAVSASAAFMPLAVQINANQGREAARAHLDECLEFLLAIMLPACIGFAVVSSHIANVILGPDFRSMAVEVMPIVSVAVIFQIMSYQYLHISFLLSERNTFYLLNTGSALAVNLVLSYLLIQRFGAIGAAWGRLVAEAFGFCSALLLTRWAFPMPVPYLRLTRVLIATIVMAIVVRSLELALHLGDKDALAVLLPAGIATYLTMCWLLNIAKGRDRLNRGLLIVRNALAR